jgi:phosphonate transport system substrate-binding protein
MNRHLTRLANISPATRACRRVLAGLAILLWCGTAPAASETCEMPVAIRFSLVPTGDVDKRIRLYRPLFDRIEALTGRPVQVLRPSSYASVVERLLGGQVDVATLGPATYVEASRQDPRITPFATAVLRKGTFIEEGDRYHSYLVTLAQAGFKRIEDLRGARLVLTDPGSTSGSLLPREEFAPRLGMPLEKYFAAVSFSGNHVKSIDQLLRADADAIFIASTQLEAALQEGKLTAGQVRILWQSSPITRDPFVYRGQLCAPLKKQLRAAFFDDQPALRTLLDALEASHFAPIDDSHYAGIRKLLDKPVR